MARKKNVVATSSNVESSTKVATVKRKSGTVVGNEWPILKLFLDNKSYQEIAFEYNMTEPTVTRFITNTFKALSQNLETRKLIESQALDMKGKMYSWAPTRALDSQINRKFVQLLSGPEDPVLTEEEKTFCYLLVYEGNSKGALKDSGLDIGLQKSIGMSEYSRLLELRVVYLKSKPNLRDYMRELQVKYVDDLRVNKVTIQAEIMRTITHLRNQDDPKNAPTIAKLLENLGRTEAVFVDKSIEDHRFSMDDSFEMMMQRQAQIQAPKEDEQITLSAIQEDILELECTPSGTYVDPSVLEEEEYVDGGDYGNPDE